jgi:predicted amino acid dehydrogenase
MTSKQMLEKKDLAKKRIFQAIKKAEKLGAKVIGLGALTSPITNGGIDLIDEVDARITNGNTLTAAVVFYHTKILINQNPHIKKIAIVGATGSVGRAISKLMSKTFDGKKYLLFARTEKNLLKLIEEMRKTTPKEKIQGYLNDLSKLNKADLIIVTTSAADAFIKKEHLKKGVTIYDITQPRNVDTSILKNRPDVFFIEGGLVQIPSLEAKLPFGLPSKTVFACFAETVLLAAENYKTEKIDSHIFVGKVKLKLVQKIWQLFIKYDFKIAPFRFVK